MKLQTAFITQLNSPRCRILMRAASIFPSRGCVIMVRQLKIFSRSSCLPTTHVMWMNSFVGDAAEILDPDSPYIALSCAGGNWITAETEAPEEAIS